MNIHDDTRAIRPQAKMPRPFNKIDSQRNAFALQRSVNLSNSGSSLLLWLPFSCYTFGCKSIMVFRFARNDCNKKHLTTATGLLCKGNDQ